jgi:hypothetical protein
MVDGHEQHDLNPAWLFRLTQRGTASRFETGSAGGAVFAKAYHTGYASLEAPVVHERQVSVGSTGTVAIEDRFDHPGQHRFRWHFLLHPAVEASSLDAGIRLAWPGGEATLEGPSQLRFAIVDSWYSPAYGTRVPTHALVAELVGAPPATTLTLRLETATR